MISLRRLEDVIDEVDWVDKVQQKGTGDNTAPMIFEQVSHCEGKWVAFCEVPMNSCAADEQVDYHKGMLTCFFQETQAPDEFDNI